MQSSIQQFYHEIKTSKFILLICIFPLFVQLAIAQEVDSVNIPKNTKGYAEYSEIVSIDSTSKNDLYLTALEWINLSYNSGKSVIQTADKEGGMIIGKAHTQDLIYNNMGMKKDGGYFSYTISIYCKENRYKYVIDNITYVQGEMILTPGADLAEKFPHNWTGLIGNNRQTRREWKSFQIQADLYFKVIIENLKDHMKTSRNKSNW